MTDLTDKLAEALKRLHLAPAPCDCGQQGCGNNTCAATSTLRNDAEAMADDALAAYEAAKAQPVTDVLDGLTGYTPGPWEWSDRYADRDDERTWSLIGLDGYGILSCDGEINSPQWQPVVGDANASLIARAPALVDALRASIGREARLRAFALDLLAIASEGCDLAGAEVLEIASEHGLVALTQMDAPCGEGCACASACGEFPLDCYRHADALKGTSHEAE